jgi:isopenicillin-N epimerase
VTLASWSEARDEMMLKPDAVYLNAGSFGPLPRPVFERACELRRRSAVDPTDFMLRDLPRLLWRARERLGEFIGASPERLMFSHSVSAAVGLVANSISVPSPGEILLTDREYPTMSRCWERAAQRLGLSIRVIRLPDDPSDHARLLDLFRAEVSERTRLFFFSHVLSATGAVLPARALCRAARSRGIVTVVDGAHAPGFLELDVEALECDFYVGSGHKWLLAPAGVGFLYSRSLDAHPLEPATVSWGYGPPPTAPQADRPDRFGSTPRLRRLECEGTRDLCAWLAVPEAIDFRDRFGAERIGARMKALSAYAVDRLAALGAWVAMTPRSGRPDGGISAFHVPAGIDPDALRDALWNRFRLEVGMSMAGDRPLLRICTHFFNTEQDVDALADALRVLERESHA